jgi:hypothetical protein
MRVTPDTHQQLPRSRGRDFRHNPGVALSGRRVPIWLLVTILVAGLVYVVAARQRDMWDFEVFRTAGVRALAAEPLYRPADGHYQFKYWPSFAFAMAPFAVMSEEIGKPIWFALSVGLLAVFIRRSIRALPDRRRSTTLLTWCAVLLTGKFIVKELVNGQTNILIGVLLMTALVAIRERRLRAAGMLVGIAILLKPYALILLPWLGATRRWPALLTSTAVVVAGLIGPALVYGWAGNLDLLADWYRTVSQTTTPNLLTAENISLATMWAKWMGAGPVASALALATTIVIGALVAALLFLRRHVADPDYLEVAILLLVVPLLSPQGWDYVLLLGTPAIVCLVDRWPALTGVWRGVLVAGLAMTSFTIYDLLGRTLYLQAMSLSLVSVGAIALVVSLAELRRRRLA